MTSSDLAALPPAALSCKRVRLEFIYSFMVSSSGDQAKAKEPVCPPELLSDRERCRKLLETPGVVAAGSGIRPDRSGPAPHLSLKPESGWVEFAPLNATLSRSDTAQAPYELKLRRLVRLFPTGATCTITAEWQAPANSAERLNTPDLLRILKMTQHRVDLADREKLLIEDSGPVRKSLHELYTGMIEAVRSSLGLHWVELEKELLDKNAPQMQNPWVVTVAEVEGEAAAAFCALAVESRDPAEAKMLRIRRFEPSIAPILYRSIADRLELEPAYIKPPTAIGVPGLYSINVDARLYVAMSRRSILCICEEIEKDPAAYFLPSLVDICEMVRARWHSLVIINKIMDEAIRKLGRLEDEPIDRVRSVKELRMMLASSLEDPTMYIIAGDALSRILDDLGTIFRLADLRSALLSKMSLIDQIYRDARELNWLLDRSGNKDLDLLGPRDE